MFSKSLFAALLFMASLFFVLSCSPNDSPFVQGNATINPILYNSLKQDSVKSISDTVGNQIEIGVVAYLPDYIDSINITVENGAKVDTVHTFFKNTAWPDTVWINLAFRSAGLRTVTFSAFKSGNEITKSAQIFILPKPITITAFSSSKSVLQGDSVTLTATVSGAGPYTYKWYKDTSAIAGAIQSSFTILNFQTANDGSYTCLITDQWGDTVRTTPAAALTITMLHAVPKWAHDTIHVEVNECLPDSITLADYCTVSNGGTVVAYSLKNGGPIADSLRGSLWKYSPTYTDSGSYTIQIQASSATDSATLTILLHVANVDRSPQFDAGKPLTSYAVKGGAQLSFAVSATDPDSDAVSYFIKSSTLPRTAPALAAKTITWQSVTTDSVNAAIVIGATDGKDTTLITVQVAVGKVNAAPSLGAQYQTQTVSKGQTIRVYEGDSAKFTFSVTDPDSGQAHVLKIADRTPLSCGTVVFDSVNYKFTFSPSFSCAAKDSVLLSNIAFVVTDNGTPPLSDTLKVNFDIINVDRAPVLMVLHDTTVFQSKQLNFMVQAVDPDNDAVTIMATGLSSAALPDSAKFDPKTGILSWTPNFNQTGTFYIVFAASDGILTTKDTTTIIVNKTNRAPIFSFIQPSVTIAEGALLSVYVHANDSDGDKVTITPQGLPFTTTASKAVLAGDTMSWTPSYTDSGAYTVVFTATDGIANVYDTLKIHVTNTNRKPVATASTANAIRNGTVSITIQGTDPDNDALSGWLITKTPTHGTAAPNPTLPTVLYTPTAGYIGKDTLAFTVSDGTLASDPANVIITIDSGTVAPKVVTQPRTDTTVNAGSSVSFTVGINNCFPTPTFTWYKVGIAASVGNGQTLTKTLAAGDSGQYFVVLLSSAGTDTSHMSHVNVLVPLSIVTAGQPQSQTVCGGNATFTVVPSGTGPFTYQWKRGGVNVADANSSGATTASLVFTNVVAGNVGSYTCDVINSVGTDVTSSAATLTLNTPSVPATGITANPASVCSGVPTTLTVNGGSLGTGAVWKWYTDAGCTVPATGTASATGSQIVVTPSAQTTYYVRAEGACGNTTASSVQVGFNIASVAPTGGTALPTAICSGGYSIVSVSGGTLGTSATWTWYNNSACSGTAVGTGSSLNVTPAATTTYFVRAEGGCATTAAGVTGAAVTVNIPSVAPTSITANPTSVCTGVPTTLTVNGGTLGTGATWKWYTDAGCTVLATGTASATGSQIVVTPSAQTTYYVRAEGTCGNTVTANAVVTINSLSTAPSGVIANPSTLNPNTSSTLSFTGGTLGVGAGWVWYSGSAGGTLIGTGTGCVSFLGVN